MKLVALISGGIDSPVAAYKMSCVGADIVLLHMDNRPFADDVSIDKVKRIADVLRDATGQEMPLYSAPHGVSQDRISKTCDSHYQCVMCKRTMLMTAEEFSRRIGCRGIVMGDSLGQVASQTLKNLRSVSHGIGIPVLRPLIGYDKLEIEAVAKDIGTYDVSIIHSDGCTIVPSKPITEADLKKVLDFDVLSGTVDNAMYAVNGTVRIH